MTTKMTAKQPRMITPQFQEIERATKEFADAAATLEERVDQFKKELAVMLSEYMPHFRRLVAMASRREAELRQLLEDNPQEFEDRKTVVLHGVKVGFTEQQGEVVFDDEDAVVELVRAEFGKRFAEFVRTTHEVNKDAVRRLLPEERMRIACRIEGEGREPYIKREAGEVDKMLEKMRNGLLKSLLGAAGNN